MKRVFLLTTSLVLLTIAASATETYRFNLSFETGQVHRYSLDQTLLVDVQPPGAPAKQFRVSIKAVLRQEILAVSAETGAELLCRLESWQQAVWNDRTPVPVNQEQILALLAAQIKLKVGPRGEVALLSPSSLPKGLGLELLADYGFFPSAPVSVGQEWPSAVDRVVQGVSAPSVVARNRLDKVETLNGTHLALVSQEFRLEISELLLPTGIGLYGQVEASGTFLGISSISFDLEAGLIQKEVSIVNAELVAKVQTGGVKAEVPMTMDLMTICTLLP